jgi:hypothetical protein
MRRLWRFFSSYKSGAAVAGVSVLWNAFWLVGPPVGIVTTDAGAVKNYLVWGGVAFIVAIMQAFFSLLRENGQLKAAQAPRLFLVFKPEEGEPYVVTRMSGDGDGKRIYRVGIANRGHDSAANVAVLLKSFRPDESHVRLFYELERMGQPSEQNGSRFEVSGDSAAPRVFVQVLAQEFDTRRKLGRMPELRLARGQHRSLLWDWKQHQLYHPSVQIDGPGAGPFMGFIYKRGDDGVYELQCNEFAKE